MIHIYHGDGKGKTTCSIGLAVRAAGAGKKVTIMQFLKDGNSSEIKALKNMENIDILENHNKFGFTWNMTQDEKMHLKKMHDNNLLSIISDIKTGEYDLVVLDELCGAMSCKLIDEEMIRELIQYCSVNKSVELVITGREPEQFVIEKADYITEMKKIRHPFDEGVQARCGIEY